MSTLRPAEQAIQLISLEARSPWVLTSALLILGYLALVRATRLHRSRATACQYSSLSRNGYNGMSTSQAQSIVNDLFGLEFPWAMQNAVGFALFKTFGIPSISKILLATGELASHLSSSKRAADTAALLFEPLANAPDSDRAAAAIARTNALHAPHRAAGRIRNDDMLYTLAVLAIEPVRWVRQYEWRSLTELELAAIGTFWRAVGDAMSVDYTPLTNYVEPGLTDKYPSAVCVQFRDGAQWLAAIERFTDAYEATDMRPAPSNTALTQARLRVLLQPGSQLTRPLRAHAFASLMPPRLRTALGLPTPPTWMQKLLSRILTFRKILLRHCFLPRPRFLAVHVVSKDVDKAGRCALELYMTHPWYVKPSLSWRWGLDAWIGRLRGEILPGDEGDKYRPEGYLVHELGPDRLKGKRVAEFEKQKAFVRGEGGFSGARCPFINRSKGEEA